jgi:hypothetical protein
MLLSLLPRDVDEDIVHGMLRYQRSNIMRIISGIGIPTSQSKMGMVFLLSLA